MNWHNKQLTKLNKSILAEENAILKRQSILKNYDFENPMLTPLFNQILTRKNKSKNN